MCCVLFDVQGSGRDERGVGGGDDEYFKLRHIHIVVIEHLSCIALQGVLLHVYFYS